MPNRIPTLVIQSPQPDAVVGTAPFSVSGLVTAPGMPEPVMIDSVTVQVDSEPPVRATMKRIPNTHLVEVTFTATLQITGGQDPHTVTVTATSDAGIPVTKTVPVTVGLRQEAPAILVDIATITNIPPGDPAIQHMMSVAAKQLASLSLVNDLANLNKIVVGPNVIAVSQPRAMLRVGVWIVDADFPRLELQAPTADFPLQRLTDDAAAACFTLVPLLPAPPPGDVPPADNPLFGFALSVPTTTLQTVLQAMLPQIQATAKDNDFYVDSASIHTNDAGTVTTTISGSIGLGIGSLPLTASLAETVGVQQAPNTVQMMPALLSSTSGASVGDLPEWFVGALVPAVGLLLLGTLGVASYGVGVASGKASGIIGAFLGSLPPRIPFRNSSLPSIKDFPSLPFDPQARYPFPMAVFNFESFTTDGSGIVASGTVGIGERDQSMVTVHLGGATYYPNYSFGIESVYSVALSHFEPDNDRMTWQVKGHPKQEGFSTDPFWQGGSFAGEFPVPLKASPGKYHFTLEVSATETCGTDPSKTLTGSASLAVTANVTNHPPMAPDSEPASPSPSALASGD